MGKIGYRTACSIRCCGL